MSIKKKKLDINNNDNLPVIKNRGGHQKSRNVLLNKNLFKIRYTYKRNDLPILQNVVKWEGRFLLKW